MAHGAPVRAAVQPDRASISIAGGFTMDLQREWEDRFADGAAHPSDLAGGRASSEKLAIELLDVLVRLGVELISRDAGVQPHL